jgi:prepilin-type N-terminal cleavage/methylation domain-containing protein
MSTISRPSQAGFTLIELLLVLAIIGIISAIAIPAMLGQRSRARDKTSVQNLVGIVSDVSAAYDRAKEGGLDPVLAMQTVINTANATNKNPWDGTQNAYVYGAATAKGQVGVVYSAPIPGVNGNLRGEVLLQNEIGGSVASGGFFKASKVVNVE